MNENAWRIMLTGTNLDPPGESHRGSTLYRLNQNRTLAPDFSWARYGHVRWPLEPGEGVSGGVPYDAAQPGASPWISRARNLTGS